VVLATVNAAKRLSKEEAAGTVLVVEDESLTRAKILRALTRSHFRTLEAGTGEAALLLFETEAVDLIVLDIMLPGMDGFELCERLRGGGHQTPIIMLTNLADMKDRLRGLGLGADDYMVKPFHPEELVARVRAVLRRSKEVVADPSLTVGDLRIEFHSGKCLKRGQDLDLTPKEFQLLDELLAHRGEAVSRAALSARVWGENHHGSDKSLDVYVGRLRQKVEDNPEEPALIQTVRGFGYLFG